MKKLIAILREKWLKWKMEREIYGEIAPRVRGENTRPYPFVSLAELRKVAQQNSTAALHRIKAIESQANGMGEADAAAFRYIMYRDINKRLARYEKIMEQRILPTTCDPSLIARRA